MSEFLKPFSEMTDQDYQNLGLKAGLEIHQQLLTEKKLFCRCPAARYSDVYDAEILRHMRPTLSELGEYDGTALMEFKTKKNIIYRINHETVCTYEMDDTPPFEINPQALDIAFQIAGREVFKMAMKSAKPILLEPIYNVAIKCPEEYMGDVLGDLSSRRGKISGMEVLGRFQVVKALVPLAELHNYATTLRSLTQGRATHTRSLSHYDPLPKELEAKIIEESKAEN